jgi:hypothetical protein
MLAPCKKALEVIWSFAGIIDLQTWNGMQILAL